ncbi:MAG: hypothetical protein ACI3W5_01915, partial [Faecousia sp.]
MFNPFPVRTEVQGLKTRMEGSNVMHPFTIMHDAPYLSQISAAVSVRPKMSFAESSAMDFS